MPGAMAGCRRKKDGYILVGVDNRLYLAHRLIWMMVYGEWPNVIDHKNGDPSDNRLVNLRNVNQSENILNSSRNPGLAEYRAGLN